MYTTFLIPKNNAHVKKSLKKAAAAMNTEGVYGLTKLLISYELNAMMRDLKTDENLDNYIKSSNFYLVIS